MFSDEFGEESTGNHFERAGGSPGVVRSAWAEMQAAAALDEEGPPIVRSGDYFPPPREDDQSLRYRGPGPTRMTHQPAHRRVIPTPGQTKPAAPGRLRAALTALWQHRLTVLVRRSSSTLLRKLTAKPPVPPK